MRVRATTPDAMSSQWLYGADFSDAFCTELISPELTARLAATHMLTSPPRWITKLMRLRNMLVRPFGLKRPEASEQANANMIGAFPVIADMPNQIVLGFDDRHLDFRVVVDVLTALDGKRKRVTVTTLVKRHNRLGRVYLALIMPFHTRVARSLLDQLHP